MARMERRTDRMRWVDQSGEEWHLLLQTLLQDEQRRSQLHVSDTLSTLGALWVGEPAPTAAP